MIRLRHADAVPVLPWPPSTGSAGDSTAGTLPMPETSFFMAYHYKEIWDREFQSFSASFGRFAATLAQWPSQKGSSGNFETRRGESLCNQTNRMSAISIPEHWQASISPASSKL